MHLEYITPEQIYTLWPKIEPLVTASFEVGPKHFTVEQTKMALTSGAKQLIVAVEDNDIAGMIVVEFLNYPNERVMFINDLGGKSVVTSDIFGQVEEWARLNGATRVCAWADDARARLYKSKLGLATVIHVVEKKL